MFLVDRVQRGPTDSARADEAELGQCLQGLLNHPEAVTVTDQRVDLAPGQRSARAQERRENRPSRAGDDSTERLVEEDVITVPIT